MKMMLPTTALSVSGEGFEFPHLSRLRSTPVHIQFCLADSMIAHRPPLVKRKNDYSYVFLLFVSNGIRVSKYRKKEV